MPSRYTPPEPEYPINPWVLGIGVFVVAMIVLLICFGQPPSCRSGWSSPSIGKQGACSHHGGVVYKNGWVFWVSAAIAAVAVFTMDAKAKADLAAKVSTKEKDIASGKTYPVPEGYDPKEYIDLRAVGFSDAETRKIIAGRRPKNRPSKDD